MISYISAANYFLTALDLSANLDQHYLSADQIHALIFERKSENQSVDLEVS